jgi:predicted NBD/HSP70 family sugar kinase
VLQALAAEHGVPVATLFISSPANGALDAALETFVRDQALTVSLAMTLTDPEIVVIGGGIVGMEGYPFGELVRQTNDCLSPVLGKGVRPIVRATLGPAAASWGALQLIRDVLRNRPSAAPLKTATR